MLDTCEDSVVSASDLRALVNSLKYSQVHYLHSLVLCRLQHDPLRSLHAPVFSLMISYLDLITLTRCARLNHTWAQALLPSLPISQFNASSGYCSRRIAETVWRCIFTKRLPLLSIVALYQFPSFGMSPSSPHSMYTSIRLDHLLRRNWTRNLARSVSLECHTNAVITCLYVDPITGGVVTASDDSTVSVWDGSRGGAHRATLRGHEGGVWALSVSHNLLVVGSTDRSLSIWDLQTGRRRHDLHGHTSTVRCVEIQDEIVVSGSRDTTLRVWDWSSGACLHVLRGHTASVRCVAAVGLGRFVSGSYDHSLRIWDIKLGRCIRVLSGHDNKVYSVSVRYLPANSESTSTFSDPLDYENDSAIHPGTLIYSGSMDSTIRVWAARTGQCLHVISGFRSLVGLMEIRQIGKLHILVAGSTDGSIQVWDAGQIRLLAQVQSAHHNSITCLAFNSIALVTGSEGIVRMWDMHDLLQQCELLETDELQHVLTPQPIQLKIIGNLIEQVDMVWRVAVSDRFAVIAYQFHGSTRMRIMDFMPNIGNPGSDA